MNNKRATKKFSAVWETSENNDRACFESV